MRALVPLALEAMHTEHEADRTNTLMMRDAVEPACETVGDILERMAVVIDGLSVDPERLRRNLDLSGGLILGEALMLDLGAKIGRQDAHDAIYDAAQAAATTGRPFTELLAETAKSKVRLRFKSRKSAFSKLAFSELEQFLSA